MSRFWGWLHDGPDISLRTFLFAYAILFFFNTFLIGAVMYLVRENKHRISEVRAAVIISCRDSNEVRAESRQIIQIIKNNPPLGIGLSQALSRYDTLTKAQAQLADERCVPLRTDLTQTAK